MEKMLAIAWWGRYLTFAFYRRNTNQALVILPQFTLPQASHELRPWPGERTLLSHRPYLGCGKVPGDQK